MIQVRVSNRLDRLAGRLVEALGHNASPPVTRLFEQPCVVVPNPEVATYLKYEVAQASGIAAGLDLLTVEPFLNRLLAKHLPPHEPPYRLFNTSTLRCLFLDVLSDSGGEPLPVAVEAYLGAAGAAGRDLRRFQLATRLARLASRYGDTDPGLLRAWAAGSAGLGDSPLVETAEWQRELWHRVVGPGGPIERARTYREWEWVLPVNLFGLLDGDDGYNPPLAVHLFGFSYLQAGLRELIDHLGRASEVCLYVLSPCRWKADRAQDLTAIRAWGEPGREFAAFLASIPAAVVQDFVESSSTTALGRLQNEILEGQGSGADPYVPDGSLRILACAGIRREAEVIAGEIWRLIREDDAQTGSKPGRLRFRDIAVLIADGQHRAEYQAHLKAAFEDLYEIPQTMIELPMAGEGRLIEAVLLLLAVPLGTFTRPELLPLLTHAAVRARFPGVDTDHWRAWCEELEIVHGADASDHAGTYLDGTYFHWEQGLRRLVLGTFLSGPRCGDDRGFLLEGADLLPQDEPVEAQADAARLLLVVRSLVADARYARGERLTLSGWSEFFIRLINAYVAAAPDADADRRALAACLAAAGALKRNDTGGPPVGYRVAYEILGQSIEAQTTQKGHYLADGVPIAPLQELRTLPFRVAFICGLGEGFFPAADGPDPLDLTQVQTRSSIVRPRDRDRYLFLETLASTRDRIVLSYVARDAQTGDELEPSPVVCELLRHLEPGRPADAESQWVRKEPLRRFEKIGRPEAPVPSPAALREERAQALRGKLTEHCGVAAGLTVSAREIWALEPRLRDWLNVAPRYEPPVQLQSNRPLEVSLSQVRQFLECPLQAWGRFSLRLAQDDEDDPANREDEPFATGHLTATMLLREVFSDALAAGTLDQGWGALEPIYERRAAVLARRGRMPVGLFREAERRWHRECLATWAAVARERRLLARGPFKVHRFGRAAENERVDVLGDPIEFDVPIGTRTVRVHLYGRTGMVSLSLPGTLSLVARDKIKEKYFLAGFLDALVLSAEKRYDKDEYHLQVLSASEAGKPADSQRLLHGVEPGGARGYLIGVLTDMLGGPHAYLLPCEAVFEYLTKGKSVAASVEDMKESDRAPCSSRWGPVPDFTLYEPPTEEEARAMIERRFGLLRACGGLG
jgi:exodeoxyribonuclease V gamma subunit